MSNPEWPSQCADCGMKVNTDAEAFIHACLHSDDPQWSEYGNPTKLGNLPCILYPIVVRLMEAYKEAV